MKNVRFLGMIILTILVSIGFVSCSKEDKEDFADDFSIVGTWQGNDGGQTVVFTFNADGSYTHKNVGSTRIDTGKYSFSGNTLTLNEWSDKEGYATFEITVKKNSSTELIFISKKGGSEIVFRKI